MRRRGPYDRGYRYDDVYPGARYDSLIGRRYDPSLGRHRGAYRPEGDPYAFAPEPFVPFGWDPMMRWGGWEPGVGYVPFPDEPPRRRPRPKPPERSPTYGRRGDAEARRWAERHGYAVERTIRPRRGRYDR
jgi:hypothetical protein